MAGEYFFRKQKYGMSVLNLRVYQYSYPVNPPGDKRLYVSCRFFKGHYLLPKRLVFLEHCF